MTPTNRRELEQAELLAVTSLGGFGGAGMVAKRRVVMDESVRDIIWCFYSPRRVGDSANLRQAGSILAGRSLFTTLLSLAALIALVFSMTSIQSSYATPSTAPVLTESERNAAISDLRARKLEFPIKGFDVERIKGSFDELRGNDKHMASDILSPRGTEIHAVDSGAIAKLFLSKAGGFTIYQFDPAKKYVYYYAHLDRYAAGLKDGDLIKKGQVIGFVGTTGDAPQNTPHLHFEITVPGPDKMWWHTAPVDPYLVFKK